MSLYAKRLERGRFIWPSPADGVIAITAAQLGYSWRESTGDTRSEPGGRSWLDKVGTLVTFLKISRARPRVSVIRSLS
jgi:transposase